MSITNLQKLPLYEYIQRKCITQQFTRTMLYGGKKIESKTAMSNARDFVISQTIRIYLSFYCCCCFGSFLTWSIFPKKFQFSNILHAQKYIFTCLYLSGLSNLLKRKINSNEREQKKN